MFFASCCSTELATRHPVDCRSYAAAVEFCLRSDGCKAHARPKSVLQAATCWNGQGMTDKSWRRTDNVLFVGFVKVQV